MIYNLISYFMMSYKSDFIYRESFRICYYLMSENFLNKV